MDTKIISLNHVSRLSEVMFLTSIMPFEVDIVNGNTLITM